MYNCCKIRVCPVIVTSFFFIALSSANIRSTFELSHGDFGLIYSSATLASAGLLIWAGRKIDEVDLRYYTTIVCFGLALACLGMASVNTSMWLIVVPDPTPPNVRPLISLPSPISAPPCRIEMY